MTKPVAILDTCVDIVVGVALVGELLAVITDVLGRTFFDSPLLWADEVSSLALSVIAFIGGAIAYRREQHVFIRTIVDLLPDNLRHACYAFVDWLVIGIAAICFKASLGVLATRWDETTPILEMRGTWLALPLDGGNGGAGALCADPIMRAAAARGGGVWCGCRCLHRRSHRSASVVAAGRFNRNRGLCRDRGRAGHRVARLANRLRADPRHAAVPVQRRPCRR